MAPTTRLQKQSGLTNEEHVETDTSSTPVELPTSRLEKFPERSTMSAGPSVSRPPTHTSMQIINEEAPDPSCSSTTPGPTERIQPRFVLPQTSSIHTFLPPFPMLKATEGEPGNRILRASAPSGEELALRIDWDRPTVFRDIRARTMWDQATEVNCARLRHQIETGEYVMPADHPLKLHAWEDEHIRAQFLRNENKLRDLCQKLIGALGHAGATPALAAKIIDELAAVPVEPFMLVKRAEVVGSMCLLRGYCGDPTGWGLTDEDTTEFMEQAELVRNKAVALWNRFMTFFPSKDGKSSRQVFVEAMNEFTAFSKTMPVAEIQELVRDPRDTTVNPLTLKVPASREE